MTIDKIKVGTTEHDIAASSAVSGSSLATTLDSKLPKAGGNVSGHVYFTGAKESSSTGNTSQIVFGTSSNNHVAISSNNNALVINPDVGSTTNQIVLYLGQESQFPNGVNKASTANKVANSMTVKLNGGNTEGTDKFTYNGAAAKTVDITCDGIGAAPSADVDGEFERVSTQINTINDSITTINTNLGNKSNVGHGHNFNELEGTISSSQIGNNTITGQHLTDGSVGVSKLAEEIGVVVVQSTEPSTNSAAKIWIKV